MRGGGRARLLEASPALVPSGRHQCGRLPATSSPLATNSHAGKRESLPRGPGRLLRAPSAVAARRHGSAWIPAPGCQPLPPSSAARHFIDSSWSWGTSCPICWRRATSIMAAPEKQVVDERPASSIGAGAVAGSTDQIERGRDDCPGVVGAAGERPRTVTGWLIDWFR